MAGKGTIGGKIVLEGESQYRSALKNIKSEQTQLRSEMKLCQTAFKENQNSLTALEKKYEILTKQIDTQSQKVKVYETALEQAKKTQTSAAQKVDDLKSALQDAEEKMKDLQGSSDDTSEAVEDQAKAIEELKSKLSLAEQDYDKISQKTASYQTSLNYANVELDGMQEQLSKTEKYMKEAESSTDKCATSIDQYGKETQDATKDTTTFGDVLKANLASDLILSGIKKLAEGIKNVAESATEAGSSFEASMSQVAATMGMTAEEVENGSESYTLLAEAAKKCGKETMFSASEAGEALNYLALAGYDAEKAAATLPKVLDLAAAGGLDLAYASDLVTDSMAALGMETEQLDKYIDEMARTSQKSNTSVAQLGEATLVCAGTVSLTGQSLETMNTELGVLANNGIKGAEGGTHFRNILLSLSAPTDTAATAIESLGLKISDSKGNMRDMNDIVTDLGNALSGMSDVEKTQIISKIFNKTDIAAVNALIKGTGEEFNNLNAEIGNCSGAAANMAETLNNNLKGKVTILQSSLEGLGISAYEIFDDEMKTSVESATDAVGRLQKSMDSGDLGLSMRKFSKSLSELVESAIGFGEKALPVAIDGLTWLMDNTEMVVPAIVGLTAATKGAAVAQEIWNAVQMANPTALLIKGIVGLTAAMASFVIAADTSNTELDESAQKTKELIEASKELNDSYKTGAEERKASRESMEAESASCKKLVDELSGLQSKTNLTTQEQARQKAIVDQLNQVMPELNLAIDEQTGKLNMSTRELERNVDALMAQAKAEAAREDMARIAEEQYEAEKQLAELEKQLEEQTYKVNEAQQKYTDTLSKTDDTALGYTATMDAMGGVASQYADKLENERELQAELQGQIDSTKETIAGYTEEYANTLEYISDTEPIDNATSAIEGMGDAATAAGEDISGMSELAQQEFAEMYGSVSESIQEQFDLFSEWDAKMVTTGENMVANMQSQVDGLQSWADNLEELADRGINKGLLQKLADMGPEGAGYVATFADMTDEELKRANELFAESLTLSDDVAKQVAESYATVGENAVQGMTDAIAESDEKVENAGKQMGETLEKSTKAALDINSPSRVYKAIGEYTIQGLIEGVKGEESNAVNTIDKLANSMVTQAKNVLQQSTFKEIGMQITNGLVEGIKSGESGVVKAIEEMCTKAVESAKKSLDIHSPSRKFKYLGNMSGKGYTEGLKESLVDAGSIISVLMNNATEKSGKKVFETGVGLGRDKTGKNCIINQAINIYSQTDDLIETSRKFKEAQREAARDW